MPAAVEKILIIGLGLIGGSLARSVKRSGFCKQVVGYGHRDLSLKKGIEQGVIDSYSLDLDIAMDGASVIVIATPTLIANDMLREIVPRLGAMRRAIAT